MRAFNVGILLLFICFSVESYADKDSGNNEVRNGGDEALEFKRMSHDLIKWFNKLDTIGREKLGALINIVDFSQTLKNTVALPVEIDADINPLILKDPEIIINVNKWNALNRENKFAYLIQSHLVLNNLTSWEDASVALKIQEILFAENLGNFNPEFLFPGRDFMAIGFKIVKKYLSLEQSEQRELNDIFNIQVILTLLNEVKLDRLLEIIEEVGDTKIHKIARNYPFLTKIEISRAKWPLQSFDNKEQYFIHEMMGLKELEKDKDLYEFSSDYMSKLTYFFNKADFIENIPNDFSLLLLMNNRQKLEDQVNHLSERNDLSIDLGCKAYDKQSQICNQYFLNLHSQDNEINSIFIFDKVEFLDMESFIDDVKTKMITEVAVQQALKNRDSENYVKEIVIKELTEEEKKAILEKNELEETLDISNSYDGILQNLNSDYTLNNRFSVGMTTGSKIDHEGYFMGSIYIKTHGLGQYFPKWAWLRTNTYISTHTTETHGRVLNFKFNSPVATFANINDNFLVHGGVGNMQLELSVVPKDPKIDFKWSFEVGHVTLMFLPGFEQNNGAPLIYLDGMVGFGFFANHFNARAKFETALGGIWGTHEKNFFIYGHAGADFTAGKYYDAWVYDGKELDFNSKRLTFGGTIGYQTQRFLTTLDMRYVQQTLRSDFPMEDPRVSEIMNPFGLQLKFTTALRFN